MRTRILAALAGLTLLGIQAVGATPARAATVSPNVNITRLGGNQSEAAIAIDPLDPNHVVELANRVYGAGMVLAVSDDGGATWGVSDFGRNDAFGRACCDPTLSWDAFGNLFMGWLTLDDGGSVPVAISTDGGQKFSMLKVLRPNPPRVPLRARCRALRTARGRPRRGGEAGRSGEGARAEPQRLVHRPADHHDRRRLGLGDVEQQRSHAGGGREGQRPGPRGEVQEPAGHPQHG